MILTDRRDYPFIEAVVYERLVFAELFERVPLIAEHNETPDEVIRRFENGPNSRSQRGKLQKSSIELSAA
jgi:hypothetical protein